MPVHADHEKLAIAFSPDLVERNDGLSISGRFTVFCGVYFGLNLKLMKETPHRKNNGSERCLHLKIVFISALGSSESDRSRTPGSQSFFV